MATSIDTLSTYEAIAAAGVDDRGARAISKAIADSVSANRADLATKADLDNLRIATKADLDNLRNATKADLDNLRISLTASIDTKIAEVGVKIADVGKAVSDSKADTLKTFWIAMASILALGTGFNAAATYVVTHSLTITTK